MACDTGSFKEVNGSSACTLCPRGKYSTSTAATSVSTCVDCPSHAYSGWGSGALDNCICNKGYTGPDGLACSACDSGKYKEVNGSALCTSCLPGMYSVVTGATSAAGCICNAGYKGELCTIKERSPPGKGARSFLVKFDISVTVTLNASPQESQVGAVGMTAFVDTQKKRLSDFFSITKNEVSITVPDLSATRRSCVSDAEKVSCGSWTSIQSCNVPLTWKNCAYIGGLKGNWGGTSGAALCCPAECLQCGKGTRAECMAANQGVADRGIKCCATENSLSSCNSAGAPHFSSSLAHAREYPSSTTA